MCGCFRVFVYTQMPSVVNPFLAGVIFFTDYRSREKMTEHIQCLVSFPPRLLGNAQAAFQRGDSRVSSCHKPMS